MSRIFETHGNPTVITLITVIIRGPKLARGPAVGPRCVRTIAWLTSHLFVLLNDEDRESHRGPNT